MIKGLAIKVIDGGSISKEEALAISSIEGSDIFELFTSANKIMEAFRGRKVDLCSITNAKSGACPENCSYCAQSSRAKTEINTYPLLPNDTVIERAKKAKQQGVKRFCVVISGRMASAKELKDIVRMVSAIRELGLLPCATLGLLNEDSLRALKDAGLHRYHHNLESSERFFPQICSSHTYREKLKTIESVKSVGLSTCSGGIFGMGEEWEDRIDMALTLREVGVDSIPINFLIPIKGTPLQHIEPLNPFEALKIISLYRFLIPQKEIRVCGGRLQTLGELSSFIFMAGADGILTGDCLTTQGRSPEADMRLIKQYGLSI